MEVLKVERVVVNLIDRMRRKLAFANLELQYEEHRSDQHDGVDTLAQPRNAVFKIHASRSAIGSEDPP